jgi:uncharacterized protein (DUF1684 family)
MNYLNILFSIICFNNLFGQFDYQNYKDSILQLRLQHASALIDSSSSILNNDEIKEFTGVDYFSVDTNYRILATFQKSIGKRFRMPTSTERKPWYRIYGYLIFEINGIDGKLIVYQNLALKKNKDFKDYLFIPFRDATNKIETYGGGRYLDFKIPDKNSVLVDFNFAYNPYCAYSSRYSCPITPEENKLLFPVYAGEKIPVGIQNH